MKPTQARVWPELVDYLPALAPLTDPRRRNVDSPVVELDFGGVRDVSSTGLAVFLLQLARVLGPNGSATIRHKPSEGISARLEGLSGDRLFTNRGVQSQDRLFLDDFPASGEASAIGTHHSVRVHHLRFAQGVERRQTVKAFMNYLKTEVAAIGAELPDYKNGLLMLLNEIAKNSADHSSADAYFCMDLVSRIDGSRRLVFAFGDLGIGIKRHIEKNLPEEEAKRMRHFSLYEAYRLALKPGYTSNRGSVVNKGHGMPIIVECASALGLHLSVFDAWSRGTLSALSELPSHSHAAIRRVFRTLGRDVGFFYYGELSIERD